MTLFLRLVHIGAGVFWAGATMLMSWFVTPAAQQAGPGATPMLQRIMQRRLPEVMSGAGIVTVAAGLWL
jgi:hypothetical protein